MRRFGLGIFLAVLGLLWALPGLAAAAEKTMILGFTASQTGKLNVEAIRQINGINLWSR